MNKKQILCLVLSLLMVLSILAPATVFADDVEILDEAVEQEDTYTELPDEVLNDEDEIINENEGNVPGDADNANQDELLEEENPAAEENNDEQNEENGLEASETLDFEAGKAAVIVEQPVNAEANVGESVTFTVQANNVKTYEWQYKLSTGSTWKAMYSSAEGKNTATLTTVATDARYKYEYRCKLTGTNGETLYTDTVKIVKGGAFEITKQPVDATANVGESVTFAVEATGVATYEWQYKAGSSWKAMYSSAQGKNTATLKTEASDARYKYEYRCKLTGTNGETLYTDTVKIVKGGAFEITKQPVDATANVGESVTFAVEATGVATYEWQYKAGSSWKAMYSSAQGKNTATLKTEASDARYKYEYRCKLTGENGETLYTDTVKIVKPAEKPEIVKQPVDASANVGESVTFAVEATGVATYEWQYKLSTGSTWKAMYSSAEGKNTPTLKTEATDARYKYDYRCKLTGENGETLYTDTVKIVKPASFVENNVKYYIIDSANVGVEKYLGSDASVKIPNTVRNYAVTEIGEEAFMGNTSVKSVDLPDSIAIIHARAFKDCTNLSEMK